MERHAGYVAAGGRQGYFQVYWSEQILDETTRNLKEQAAALRNPPRTLEDIVRGLAKSVPEFAKSIAEHAQISLT